MATFNVNGRVINTETRAGIAGLRVEAWDKALIYKDLVGSAITDAQGNFRIEWDESYFRKLFSEQRPELFFRVFRKSELVTTTENSVFWNTEVGESMLTIEVDISSKIDDVKSPIRPNMMVLNASGVSSTLASTDFSHSVLTEVKLFNSRLHQSNLEGCAFDECDFDGAIFSSCSFRGVEFSNCDIDKLVINGVNIGNLLRVTLGNAGGKQ